MNSPGNYLLIYRDHRCPIGDDHFNFVAESSRRKNNACNYKLLTPILKKLELLTHKWVCFFYDMWHYSLTCKRGGDVGTCHNSLRDVFIQHCQFTHVTCLVEMGSEWGSEKSRTRPADVLIPNWSLGKPAALDLCCT